MSGRASILVVEDNGADVLLLERAFVKARILNRVHFVRSREEAISYFKGTGKYAGGEEHLSLTLILIDVTMERAEGLRLLRWIREQPGLESLRVVAMARSKDLDEVRIAEQLGADGFLAKTLDFDQFCVFSQALGGYWLWQGAIAA